MPQMAATTSADQPLPIRWPSAHHRQIDKNSTARRPATPAAPSAPAALPDLLASAFSSAWATVSSWRISVDRSRVTLPTSSPTGTSPTSAYAPATCGGGAVAPPGGPTGPGGGTAPAGDWPDGDGADGDGA